MFKKIKLRTRLLFFGISLTALPLLFALGLVIFQNNQSTATAREESIKLADADFKHLVQGVHTLATTQQELIEKELASSLNVAENQAQQRGGLSAGTEMVTWKATNQLSNDMTMVALPKMQIGPEWLGQVDNKETFVPVVDDVRDLVQTTCTIFQRMNTAGDMLRVATNVLNTNGTRAIATYIPSTNPDGAANPVVQAVMKGETYVGRAYVVNAWYITAYKPILDAGKQIIGMLYVGVPQESTVYLRKAIMDMVVGKTGTVEVFDSKGTYVISKGGSQDGKVVMDLKDSAGQPYIEKIVKGAASLAPGEVGELRTSWKESGSDKTRAKIFKYTYFKKWDWVIVASTFEDEILGSVQLIEEKARYSLYLMTGLVLLSMLLGILAAVLISNKLTLQINKIMEMFGNIGIGDFSARAEVVSDDELGEMAETMNAMLDNTLALIQSRDERDAIQASIMNLLTEISDLADGDLTVRAEVTEEVTGAIADSFNAMAVQLSEVVKGVKQSAVEVGRSSQEVEQSTRDLAQFSEKQAEKIQEAIVTIKDLATAIRNISQHAGRSAEVSNMAMLSAQEGSMAVKKTNEAMSAIKDNMRGTARTIKRLGESSQEIGNITQIINDIADRTSILALNASIQAAMAGDAGRGFAVVAEEVQRLAERSAGSTKQIGALVTGIQQEIVEAAASMEKSIQYVVTGTELSDEAFNKLEEIETVSNQLAATISDISSTAQQQSRDSELIADMMEEVGVLTTQTTGATRDTVASMEKIASTSKRLAQSIATFKLGEEEAAVQTI
jgi:methyl-accepting chemotaxis protein